MPWYNSEVAVPQVSRKGQRMSDEQGMVTVEFYGVPRQRAGRAELPVAANTIAELLAEVERACPGLAGLRRPDGRPAPHYLLSIEGRRFVSEATQELRPGDRILLLSADAGG